MTRTVYVETPADPNEIVFFPEQPAAGWFRVEEVTFSGSVTFVNGNRWHDTHIASSVQMTVHPVGDRRATETHPAAALLGVTELVATAQKYIAIDDRLTVQTAVEKQQRANIARLAATIRLIAELYLIDPEMVTDEMNNLLHERRHLLEEAEPFVTEAQPHRRSRR